MFFALLLSLLLAATTSAQEIKAHLLPAKDTIFLGETCGVTLLVEGSGAPAKPDLAPIQDFQVRFLQGRSVVERGKTNYVFQYDFVPKRIGVLEIPALTLAVGDQEIQTAPVALEVRAPEETPDLRLLLALSKPSCYIGEPVTLTITWYCALPLQTVKAVDLQLPILRDERFDVHSPHIGVAAKGPNAIGLPVSDTRVIAERGETSEGERVFTTMTFQRVLVPREAGRIALTDNTVYCAALVPGPRARRSWNQYPSYFDNDFFDKDVTGEYTRQFARAVPVTLEVMPLPETQAPAGFTGIVVEDCRIQAAADPAETSAGAPVTLTLRLSAASHIEHFELSPLTVQSALAQDFDVPPERSLGRIQDNAMVFQQTIRPRHAGVTAIPPIEIIYFDPAAKSFARAVSEAIPITVNAAQAVTAYDAEGAGQSALRRNIDALQAGFLEYRSGGALLKDQSHKWFGWGGIFFWLIVLVLPPLPFVVIAGRRELRRRREVPPETLRARQAHGAFKKRLTHIPQKRKGRPVETYTALEKALRKYLADHLKLSAGALTYIDVEQPLRARGIRDTVIQKLRALFDECLAHRFSGGSHAGRDPKEDLEHAENTIREIEGDLK